MTNAGIALRGVLQFRLLRRSLWLRHLKLSAVNNHDSLGSLAALAAHRLDGLHNVHSFDDLAEHDVLPIEPGGLDRANEELRPIGAGPRVRHREDARSSVLQLEVLIRELLAVDGLAARAVASREVAPLQHELRDHAVEGGALVVQRLARLAQTFLARRQRAEVLNSLRDGLAVQAHDDAAGGLAVDFHVEEHLVRHRRPLGCGGSRKRSDESDGGGHFDAF
mmetsp:Transcript_23830/g.54630  ORF Transcript_23830/g.54630 Transcript_23830/m.54630 type:complete len:222 (+) Transcript_23830:365-1030(+)